MYCRYCSSEVNTNAEYCMSCGRKPLQGSSYCYNCSAETAEGQEICLKCGVNLENIRISEFDTNKDIYCRHCGSEVHSNAEYCMSCGKRPFGGKNYCQNCGHETSEDQEICIDCGVRLQNGSKSEQVRDDKLNTDGLSEYHQAEFKKIRYSNESYKGKWNWAAFFLGTLWALSKGMWQIALVTFIVAYLTSWSYIIPLLIWTLFGLRGNYLYYRFKEYDEVFPDFQNLF